MTMPSPFNVAVPSSPSHRVFFDICPVLSLYYKETYSKYGRIYFYSQIKAVSALPLKRNKEGLKTVGFEYIGPLPNSDAQTQDALPRQSLATSNEQTQLRRQKQVTDSNSNTVEPSYREHSSNSASLPPLETLSFYPPRLPYQQEQSTQQQLPGPPYPAWQSHQSPVASQPSAPPQQQPYPATPIPPYAGWQFYQPPPAAHPPAQPQQQPYPAMSAPSYPFAGYPPGIQYPYGYNGYGYPQVPPSAYPGYEGFWSPHSPYLYPQLSQMPQPRRDSYQFTVAIISTICSGLVMLPAFFSAFTLLSSILPSPILP